MFNFTFYNPTTIYFGRGQIEALEAELRARADKVLIVTGVGSVKKNGIFDEVLGKVKAAGVDHVELAGIRSNPRIKSIYEGIEIARKENVDFILPVGGGSVIDAAKTIAAGVKYNGDVWDFFEGRGRPQDALPLGTVLTVAATGSEMNSNAVITKEDTQRKLSLSSPFIRPVFSVLDPAYTFTVNSFHTAAGVADIMAHVFEYYFTPVEASEVQDYIAEALLRVCIKFGPVVCSQGDDYDARSNIMWASTLALNGTIGRGKISDWTCHAIEHEISAIYDISHGLGLATILPAYMKVMAEKFGEEKLIDYGKNVWGMDKGADEAVKKTEEFFRSLGLTTTLAELNITDEHFDKIADNVMDLRGKMDDFNQLSRSDILKILTSSL